MSGSNFRRILEQGGIFLSRADKVDDKEEATLSRANARYRTQIYKDEPVMRDCYGRYCQELPNIKRHTYISCWRLDEAESAQSWKEYTNDSEGVAIQTTYEKLRRYTHFIFCARMEYIDYRKTWVIEHNSLSPFMFKKRRFGWEREFRIILQQFPRTEMLWKDAPFYNCSQENPSCGRTLEVDFKQLLDQIITAPNASDESYREVKLLAEKYGLGERVYRSRLNGVPSSRR